MANSYIDQKKDQEFRDNIDFLRQPIHDNLNNNIELQSTVLNSEKFNKSFKAIEDSLNMLYEKTRVYENAIAFAKEIIKHSIHDINLKCADVLDEISNIKQSSVGNRYITFEIPKRQNNRTDAVGLYQDRDGEILAKCVIDNNNIYPSSETINKAVIENAILEKPEKPIASTVKNLAYNKEYRSIYFVENGSDENVQENVWITFNTPIKCNKLNIETANSIIEQIKYIYEDNTESIDSDTSEQTNKRIKSIRINLKPLKSFDIDIAQAKVDDLINEIKTKEQQNKTYTQEDIINDILNYISKG